MSRPTLIICRSCSPDGLNGRRAEPFLGETLYQNVKALRRERDLKPVFAVEGVSCLHLCESPCSLQLEGKRRSTYTRTHVNAVADAEAVVQAACAYARLEPGEELTERSLPGVSAD